MRASSPNVLHLFVEGKKWCLTLPVHHVVSYLPSGAASSFRFRPLPMTSLVQALRHVCFNLNKHNILDLLLQLPNVPNGIVCSCVIKLHVPARYEPIKYGSAVHAGAIDGCQRVAATNTISHTTFFFRVNALPAAVKMTKSSK